MHITRTKKALFAVFVLVLAGIFVALAAIYMPGAEEAFPLKDGVVSDVGDGASGLAAVSANTTAPREDGQVSENYVASGTGINNIATARGDLDGNYYLSSDITVTSLDLSGNTFSGTLDGNGKTITITATGSGGLIAGGLFSKLSGTVKNVTVKVTIFSFNTSSAGQRDVGIIAGVLAGGTVDNVKIILQYSPGGSDPSQGIGNVAAYFYDNGQHSGKDLDTFFGGVAGSSTGGNIRNTTVHNATSGSYGVSIVSANSSSWLGGGSSDNAMGLFLGCATSGTTNFTNIRVTENTGSKISSHFYQSSHDKRSLIGVVWGWGWSESTVNVDGVIYDTAIDFARYVHNAGNLTENINPKHAGSMNGWQEGSISVKNLFAPSELTYIDGKGDTIRGTIYTSDKVVAFDDSNVGNIIVKATFANPTASSITSTVTIGNSTTNVLQALTVGDGEAAGGSTAYVSVAKSTQALSQSTPNYNVTYGNAQKGTMNLGNVSFSENRADGYYVAREYDGTAEANRSISLSTGKTINNVYADNSGLGKNVGVHNLAYNADALGSAYKLVTYNGIKYLAGEDGYVYSPDKITINGQQSDVDITKAQIVEITPRSITLGNSYGDITYGDSHDSVLTNNIPVATSGSFVSGEYVESYVINGYEQFAVNAGNTETFSYSGIVIKDASGNDVTANYGITFADGSAIVKQRKVAGMISVVDLTYDGNAKEAVFVVDQGFGLFNEDAVTITYDSGDRVNVTAEGFVATATLPTYDGENSNYTFEYTGNSISRGFVILPYEVTISAKDDRPVSHAYNSGVVSVDDLFDAPVGLGDDGELLLSMSVTKDGAPAAVELVGAYKVTASLAEGQDNYTATSVTVDYEVTPYIVEIGINEDIEKSMVYDGVDLTEDEMKALFVAPKSVEGADMDIVVTVDGGRTVLNADIYDITATVADLDETRYMLKEDVTVAFEVVPVVIDGEIIVPEDSVYDGSEKSATFEFAENSAMVGNDKIVLTYATQGGQDVPVIVSAGTYTVSAALPAYEDGKSNYKWANGVTESKVIVIDKAPVVINKGNDVSAIYSGAAFTDYASLFTAPDGVNNDGKLSLSFSVVKGDEAVSDGIVNAGVYTVTATLEDNGVNANYDAAAAIVTYTITPVTIDIVWSENDYTYNASVQNVSAKYATVDGGEVQLAVSFGEGVEFRNAGKYTATASFAQGDNALGNYALPENASNSYNIRKADSVIDIDGVVKTYTYTGSLQTVDSGATLNHAEATLVYGNNSFTTVAEGDGLEVTVSVADTDNYNGASTSFVITVNKATPAVTAQVTIPDGGLFTSSEMPAIAAETAVEGEIAWDADQSLIEGENAYGWTFTPADTDNYEVVAGNYDLAVVAVALSAIEIETQPNRLNYEYGDKFDKTGMVVVAVYNDGNRQTIEDYTLPEGYLTNTGEDLITVAYNGMTATVAINVAATEFDMEFDDLTVVAGTQDFDIASITASISGTQDGKITIAGTEYDYTVVVAYADAQYDPSAAVGTEYPLDVTVAVNGLDAQNYIAAYTATLRVIATPMTGSWVDDSVTAVYDGVAHNAVFSAENGLTEGVDYQILYAVAGTDVWTDEQPVNAGEYVAKVESLNESYSSDRLPVATVTITAQLVVIAAVGDNAGAVYSGTEFTDFASLFTAPQGVNGEGALDLSYTVTKDGASARILDAGVYTVTAILANADGNYTAEPCVATYTVSHAEISVVWTGENSVVYSGETYEPAVEISGLVGGDKVTVTYQATTGDLVDGKARNAGSYTATVSLPSANYVFAADTATTFVFEIERVKVSYEALLEGNTKYVEYGGTYVPSVGDFYSASVENSERFEFYFAWSMEFDLTGIDSADAGTEYEAAVEGRVRYVGGADITEKDYDNFELIGDVADVVVYVEITAKRINVTADDGSAIYDGEKVGVEELLAMFELGGVSADVTVNDEGYNWSDIKNVGAYTVKVSSANANYEFTGATSAIFTVEQADLTGISVTGYDGTYDKTAHGAVVGATAVTVDGTVATFSYATSEDGVYGEAPEFTNAGFYTVWYKVNAVNHNEEKGSFIVTIAKADYDMSGVIFEDATLIYNGSVQSIAATNLPVGVSVTYTEGKKDVGSVVITAVFDTEDDNYNAPTDTMQATLTISPKSLTVDGTFAAVDREYDGTLNVEVTVDNDTLQGIIESDQVAVSAIRGVLEDKNAGTGKAVVVVVELEGEDSDNYRVVTSAITVNVSPVELDVVWGEELSFDYNGQMQAPTASATTDIPGDTVTIVVNGGMVNAGIYTATAVIGNDEGNYTLTNDTVQFAINRIASVIDTSGVVRNYVYNGRLQTVNSGATLNHDEAVLVYSNNTFTTVAEGDGMTVTVSVEQSANYLAASETFVISVAAKRIPVIWGELRLVYDGTAKVPTATADTGIDGDTVVITVSGAKTEPGTYTATATTDNANYALDNATVQFTIARAGIVAQIAVGYGELTVTADVDEPLEYSVDGGEWSTLPDDGKISVDLAESWTVKLRYEGEIDEIERTVYTTAENVSRYLAENVSTDALANKDVVETAKRWLATATGDKTQVAARLAETENAYNAAKDELAESVENAFKATANATTRTIAVTVAIGSTVTALGLVVGMIAVRRKGGKKNED